MNLPALAAASRPTMLPVPPDPELQARAPPASAASNLPNRFSCPQRGAMLAGMRNNPTVIHAAVAAVLAFPCLAAAAESHRCSGVLEDAQRLACYDTAFGKPVRPATSAAPAPAPAPAVVAPRAPVVTPAPVVQRSAPAPASAAAASPAPAAASTPASTPPAQPVSARITAVSRLSNDRFAITLDNGQVWTQLERDLARRSARRRHHPDKTSDAGLLDA